MQSERVCNAAIERARLSFWLGIQNSCGRGSLPELQLYLGQAVPRYALRGLCMYGCLQERLSLARVPLRYKVSMSR